MDSRLPAKKDDNQESLFVAKISQGGHAFLYSTLIYTGYSEGPGLTGAPTSAGQAIGVDAHGGVYLTKAAAPDFPTTSGVLQSSSAGGDAVVFKLAADADSLTLAAAPAPATAGQPLTLTAKSSPNAVSVNFYDGGNYLGVAPVSGDTAVLTTTLNAGIHFVWASFSTGGSVTDAAPVVLVVDPGRECD